MSRGGSMSGNREATVAALYVASDGVYAGHSDVDLWDEERDARLYDGPWPVVAHPPCQRWCRFAKGIEKVHGYKVGDDGGCFEAALDAVRTYGGVLEHPAHSLAWDHFELLEPQSSVGWTLGFSDPGATCYIEQGRYGHPMRKATWLYVVGIDLIGLELRWGKIADQDSLGRYKWGSRHYKPEHDRNRPRVDSLHSVTPPAFAEVLLDMARSVTMVAAQ